MRSGHDMAIHLDRFRVYLGVSARWDLSFARLPPSHLLLDLGQM